MKPFSLLLSLLFLFQQVMADSPITSIDFKLAYQSAVIVQTASKTKGILSNELMNYLVDEKNPIALKIAVINQLGWDFNGKNNTSLFLDFLKKEPRYSSKETLMTNASGDLLICIAYLKAMDDYFEVDEAIEYARKAKEKKADSYTIHMICAMIEGQKAMVNEGCKVYQLANDVRKNKSLKKDMNRKARKLAFEYLVIYKKGCKAEGK